MDLQTLCSVLGACASPDKATRQHGEAELDKARRPSRQGPVLAAATAEALLLLGPAVPRRAARLGASADAQQAV